MALGADDSARAGKRSSPIRLCGANVGAIRSLHLAHLLLPHPLSWALNTGLSHSPLHGSIKSHSKQTRPTLLSASPVPEPKFWLAKEMDLRSSQESTVSSWESRHANQIIPPWPSKNQEDIMGQIIWGPTMPKGERATQSRSSRMREF